MEIWFKEQESVNEYWDRGSFMQTLFDDFRSRLGELDEDVTMWNEGYSILNEKIIVLRTKELGRYELPEWRKADVGKLIEGKECVLGGPTGIDEDEGGRPAFHIQKRYGGPGTRNNHCTRCQPDCGCHRT